MGEAKFRARRSATPGTTAISSLLKRTSLHDNHTANSQATAPPTASSRCHKMVTPPGFLRRDAQTLHAIRTLPRSANVVLFTPVVPPEPEAAPSSGDETGAYRKNGGHADADVPMDPFEPLGRALSRHHSRVRHVPYVPSVGMTRTHQTFLQNAWAIVLVVVCNGEEYGRRPSINSNSPRRPSSSGPIDPEVQHQQTQLPDRSSHIPPSPRQSSVTPTQTSFKEEELPSSHRGPPRQPSDFFFRFVSQALVAAEELRERAASESGDTVEPIPTVLLLVGDDEAETVRRTNELDMLMDELAMQYEFRSEMAMGPGTALVSRRYSAEALRRVADLLFGMGA